MMNKKLIIQSTPRQGKRILYSRYKQVVGDMVRRGTIPPVRVPDLDDPNLAKFSKEALNEYLANTGRS